MKPGATISPPASIRSRPSAAANAPTAAIRPPEMATSARFAGAPEPSTTRPPAMTRSKRGDAPGGRAGAGICAKLRTANSRRRARVTARAVYGSSGDRGSEAVVAAVARAGTGDADGAHYEIRVDVGIAVPQLDDVRLPDERLAGLQRELDPVSARFDLEGKTADPVGRFAAPLAALDVHDFDDAAVERVGAFGAPYRPGDGPSGGDLGTGVERGGRPAARGSQQRPERDRQPGERRAPPVFEAFGGDGQGLRARVHAATLCK